MFDRLKALLDALIVSPGDDPDTSLSKHSGVDGLEVSLDPSEPMAYAALLIELAAADGEIEGPELRVIEQALEKQFGLPPEEVNDIVGAACARYAAFRGRSSMITKIKEEYSPEEQQVLFKALQDVIAADGEIDSDESLLEARLKSLLQ